MHAAHLRRPPAHTHIAAQPSQAMCWTALTRLFSSAATGLRHCLPARRHYTLPPTPSNAAPKQPGLTAPPNHPTCTAPG